MMLHYKYYGSVDYDEFEQSSYKGIEVFHRGTDDLQRFDTGNFTVDFIDLIKWLDEKKAGVLWGSSIDHFYMDGEDYEEMRVCHAKDNKIVNDVRDPDYWGDSVGYPVPADENIESFEQLVQYYKKHKSNE